MPSPPIYSLGPLPWSDETLVAAVWKNFAEAEQFVAEHPGRLIFDQLASLRAVLKIFEGSVRRFSENLARFHEDAQNGYLFRRNRKSDLEAYEQEFQQLLYLFSSSAMTLVDQARTFSRTVDLPGYAERVKATFATNSRHRFIHELRVDLIHVTLHQPGWQLTSGKNEEPTSKFMLRPGQLRRSKDYNAQAKRFLSEHPKGVDIGALVTEYAAEVREFHDWLHRTAEETIGPQLADYSRCTRCIRAVSARAWWNILLQQVVIAGKRDPYDYLDQYLTADELNEVAALRHRSKKQVDRIIEMIDDFKSCDDELRKTVYLAFSMNDA